MTNQKKVWNKHKITAIAIMLIVIAIIVPAYIESDYSAFNTPESLEKSISKYIDDHDVHTKVIQTKQIEKDLLVSFTDERYPNFMGIARFQKGTNFMWQPVDITYGNNPSVDTYYYGSYTEEGKIRTIVYGVDVDPRITAIKGEQYEKEPSFNLRVTEPNFIEYYEINKPIYVLSFFDADGNDITLELLKEYDISGPEANWFFNLFGSSSLNTFGTYLFYFLAALYIALYIGTRNSNPIRYYDENTGRKEKETHKGLKNKWKNLGERKQAALIILAVSVLAVTALYSINYSISLPEDNLTKIIEDYTFADDTNLTILKTEQDGNRLFVLCKADDNPYDISLAYFERGLNGRWRINGHRGQTGMCISSFGNHYYDDRNHMIIVGAECDPRAVSYEVVYEHPYNAEKEPILVYSNNITEPNFIHIYETGNYQMTQLKIYDTNGENIEPELFEKYSEEEIMQSFSGIGGPEGRSMNSIFTIIIIINLIAFWFFWIEKPKRKE